MIKYSFFLAFFVLCSRDTLGQSCKSFSTIFALPVSLPELQVDSTNRVVFVKYKNEVINLGDLALRDGISRRYSKTFRSIPLAVFYTPSNDLMKGISSTNGLYYLSFCKNAVFLKQNAEAFIQLVMQNNDREMRIDIKLSDMAPYILKDAVYLGNIEFIPGKYVMQLPGVKQLPNADEPRGFFDLSENLLLKRCSDNRP